MEYIKDLYLFSSRVFGQGKNFFWVGSLVMGVDFEGNLLPLEKFWDLLWDELGAESLDWGFPKEKGEVLVLGSWFSPEGGPITRSYVRLVCGNIDKKLYVVGPRRVTKDRFGALAIGDPEEIDEIRVDYSNAYGGESHPINPMGKGFSQRIQEGMALPLIEDPLFPLVKPTDKGRPVGFAPLPWQAMMEKKEEWGSFGEDYIESAWPNFPEDMKWSLFNRAPSDQQIQGFWSGPIRGKIWNMHPEKRELSFTISPPSPRVVVVFQNREEEFSPHMDTLWLFPSLEVVALIYRLIIPATDDEASEIQDVRVILEKEREDEIFSGDAGEDSAAQEEVFFSHSDTTSEQQEEVFRKGASDLSPLSGEAVIRICDGDKIFSGRVVERVKISSKDLVGADFSGCVLQGVVFEDVDLKESNFSNSYMEDVRFYKVNLRGANMEGMEGKGVVFEYVNGKDSILMGTLFKDSRMEEVDLSGVNFQDSCWEEVEISNSDLSRSDLYNGKIKGAQFKGVKWLEISAARCVFENCHFEKVDFSSGDLSQSSVIKGTFIDCILEECDFSDALFREVKVSSCSLKGVSVEKVKLEGVRFKDTVMDEASGDECTIRDSVFLSSSLRGICFQNSCFEASIFEKVKMLEANLCGSSFTRVDMNITDMSNSSFIKSRWQECRIVKSNMFRCDLHKSIFSSSEVISSNLFECNLFKLSREKTPFVECILERTLLER